MGKSVLLVNTPEKCKDCDLLYHCHKYDDVINFNIKPDWCPLTELPNAVKAGTKDDFTIGYCEGYNDFRYEISGEMSICV